MAHAASGAIVPATLHRPSARRRGGGCFFCRRPYSPALAREASRLFGQAGSVQFPPACGVRYGLSSSPCDHDPLQHWHVWSEQ